MPLLKESVLKSVTEFVSENSKLTDYKEGYENWRKAFDSNKGGIFPITVGEAVKYVEEAISNAGTVEE